jgi:hypothetical protein
MDHDGTIQSWFSVAEVLVGLDVLGPNLFEDPVDSQWIQVLVDELHQFC